MEKVITVRVADVRVGDKIVTGDTWWTVGKIEEGRLTRTLRDRSMIIRRAPSRYDDIKIQVPA